MTKKITLWISGIISVVLLAVNYFGTFIVCNFGRSCAELLANNMQALFIFIPLFLILLIIYKLRIEIYNVVMKFVFVWVPLTIILVFISPEYPRGNSLIPLNGKSFVSQSMSLLFVVISLIIIFSKYFSTKNSNK
jgi:hypothetical protein